MQKKVRNKCLNGEFPDPMYSPIQISFPYEPFPTRQILDFSKLKELADDNFNLMKMAESSPNG